MTEMYATDDQAGETPEADGAPIPAGLAVRLMDEYRESRDMLTKERAKGREAHRFYDGEQWEEAVAAELVRQGRPPLVVNQIFKAINNLSGKQRDARLDYRAFPRGENDVLTAAAVTKGAAYLEDASGLKAIESSVFKEAAIGPLGWVQVGYDDTDPTREDCFVDFVPWDEVLRDPFGRDWRGMTDFRYLIREKDLDLDMTLTHPAWRKHAAALEAAARQRSQDEREMAPMASDYGNHDDGHYRLGRESDAGGSAGNRRRVKVREHHYWVWEPCRYVMTASGDKIDFDESDPASFLALREGGELRQGRKRCFYEAIMVGSTILEHRKSILPFDRYSYVPLFGYIAGDGRAYGLVDVMMWPQKAMNINDSRLNEAQRSRWLLYQKGALGNTTLDDATAALAKSNFALEVADPNGIQIGTDKTDVAAWMEMRAMSAADVDSVAGQNEASYGDKSNEQSGKAIDRRVAQQGLNMGELFDNWRHFRLVVGKMLLSMAIKWWPQEKWARVAEQATMAENADALLKAQMMGQPPPPAADFSWVGRGVAGINSLFRFDLRLEDVAETATERMAAMEQAVELVGYLPDPAKAAVVPDIIRMSDFPGKDSMASKAEAAMAPAPMPGMGMPPSVGSPPMPPDGTMGPPPGGPSDLPPPAALPPPAGFPLEGPPG